MSNFDNQIKQKSENFSLQPRPQVWKRVETELDKQHRSRLIGWWWLTPVIIIAWGFAFYFQDRKEQKAFYNQAATHLPLSATETKTLTSKPSTPTTTSTTLDTKVTEPAVTVNAGTSQPKTNSAANAKTQRIHQGKFNASKNIVAEETNSITAKKSKKINSTANPTNVTAVNTGAAKKESNNKTDENVYASSQTQKTAVKEEGNPEKSKSQTVSKEQNNIESQTKQTLSTPDEKSTSPSGTELSKKATQPDQTTVVSHSNAGKSVAIGNTAETSKTKKTNWRFTLGGGISNSERSIFTKAPKIPVDTTNGGGGSGGTVPTMENNSYSFNVLAGFERLQKIGKRFEWRSSVLVQYQQLKQHTGELQPYPVDPSPPDWTYSSYYYADPGKDIERKGENFRIMLSNDIAYALPLGRPSLYVKAGVFGGYNIYNHFMMADEIQYWWIPGGSKYYANWFGGVTAGLEYRFKGGSGFSVTAMHDLTEAYKPLTTKTLFWRSASLTYSLPLNFK